MALVRVHNFNVSFTIHPSDLPSLARGPGGRRYRRAAVAYLAEHLPGTLVRLQYDSRGGQGGGISVEMLAERPMSLEMLSALKDRYVGELRQHIIGMPPTGPCAPDTLCGTEVPS